MPPISSIRRLPQDLRRAIEEQLTDGHSLDEIVAHVRALGGDASRSAIWRHNTGVEAGWPGPSAAARSPRFWSAAGAAWRKRI